jgi:hypothetical protein
MGYKSFEELEVYKAAREFRKKIYKVNKMLNGYIAYHKKRQTTG